MSCLCAPFSYLREITGVRFSMMRFYCTAVLFMLSSHHDFLQRGGIQAQGGVLTLTWPVAAIRLLGEPVTQSPNVVAAVSDSNSIGAGG